MQWKYGVAVLQLLAALPAAAQAPRFEVDPLWPKPLPNHWVLGAVVGVAVDARDHVWIVHREGSLEEKEKYASAQPPAALCCSPAPPVLEFDAEGNLVGHWGGPGEGFDWPASMHGVDVDYQDNVWLCGSGRGAQPPPNRAHDSMVLKFTRGGKFLLQIGRPNQGSGSNDRDNLRLPAKTLVDRKANELYVADGYGNRRVIVFDAATGKYKRHWGAYGERPDDAAPAAGNLRQFGTPVHGLALANDGLLYVCDRTNNRIQVFRTDGTFVREGFVERNTRGDGTAFDVALSRDPQQRFLYLADGSNMRIHVLQRDTLEVLTSFGDGGRQPGQFYAVHSIATDSQGNLYTTETYRGQRVQKFRFRGLAAVTKKDQGVVWPQPVR
jgi:hypothetical protein